MLPWWPRSGLDLLAHLLISWSSILLTTKQLKSFAKKRVLKWSKSWLSTPNGCTDISQCTLHKTWRTNSY
jgi:hypothetical protein